MANDNPYKPVKPKTVEHETPEWLYKQLDGEFHFTVDLAASRSNAKCRRYFSERRDMYKQDWSVERGFLNPPFDHLTLKKVTAKAWEDTRRGGLVVMLVPAKTDQSWWHRYALKVERRFIPGRVRFGGQGGGHPDPIIVLVFERGRRVKAVSLVRADRQKK